jgi:membrane protein implicated in regulation of membrane protease activity
VTEPERRREDDGMRYPDPRPLRLVQLATVALILIVVVLTLTSGSRPAEVRWGSLAGLIALTLVVFRRWRARRRRPPGQKMENSEEIRGNGDRQA